MMDIRIKNTKERIQQGLLQLLQTTSFNELTTSEILEAADVSRKTFYAHYRGKQDLLNELTNTIADDLAAALKADRQVLTELDHVPSRQEIYSLAQESFTKTVQVIDYHRDTLRVLLSQHGDPRLVRLIHQVATQEFLARSAHIFNLSTPPLTPPKVPVQLPMDYVVETYVGALIALLIHWVRSFQPMPASRMAAALGCVQVMSPLQLVYIADETDNFPEPVQNNN